MKKKVQNFQLLIALKILKILKNNLAPLFNTLNSKKPKLFDSLEFLF